MIDFTIGEALNALGYSNGWAASESLGIILWEHDDPQPTEEQLIAAGWVKKDSAE